MKRALLSMLLALMLVPWTFLSAQNCREYSVATVNSTNALPFSSASSRYSWTQMIYTPYKIGGTGTIRSISFLATDHQPLTDSLIVVYMGTVADSVAASTSGWVAETALTEVFRATNYQHLLGSGWETITLDVPFQYDGTANLVVCISSTHVGPAANMKYAYAGVTTRTSLYRQGSTAAYAAHPGAVSGSTSSYLPFTTFCFTGTCNAPGVPAATNITANSADVAWAASSATSYQYLCLAPNDIMDWANAQTTTSLSVSLSNLTANTAYRFYVRSACSTTEYSNEVLTRFRTGCPATQSVPYSIDFEDQVIGGSNIQSYPTFVDCWDRICDASSYANQGWPYIYSTTTSARSGDRVLYFSQQSSTSTTLDQNIAVLPQFSQAANTLQLSFWAKKSNATTAGFIITGVMSDPTDATTFTAVDTFEFAAANNQFTQCVSFLNKYTGTGNYIAICCTKNRSGITSAINFFVDDIEVEALPSCFTPKTPTLRRVTSSSAVVEWVPNGPETQWQLQYKSVDSLNWIDYPTILTVDSCVLSGLAGNTRLDVRVRAYCSATDQSEWSNALSFVTDCDEYISIPYVANFDNEPTGGTNGTTYPNFVHCWSRLTDKSTSANYNGYPYVAAIASYQRTGSGKVVYFAQYPSGYTATYPTYQMAILPAIDTVMTPISSLQLSFWAKKSSTTMPGRIVVGAMSDPTDYSTFTGIDTIDILTLTDNTYHQYTSVLHPYTGNASHIAIMVPRNIAGVTTNSQTSYIYLDDVELNYGPTCFAPKNVTADSVDARFATISWTPDGLESAWNLRYKLAADTTWTVVPGTVTSPYTINNLTPNKIYEVSVRSACDVTDFSLWTQSMQFQTLCAPVTAEQLGTISFEATEGFVTGTGKLANCWTVGNLKTTTNTYIPYAYNGATYAHTGAVSMQMNVYRSSTADYDSAYAILPEIDFTTTPLSEYDLQFYIKRGGSNSTTNDYTDTLWVGVVTDRADFSTFQKLGYVLGNTTDYIPASFSFAESQLTSGHITLLAAYNQSATTTYARSKFYIDDIRLVARKYSITANVNDTTMGAVEVYADSLAYGQVDTLVATPAPDYYFAGWSNGSTANPLYLTVTSDTVLTANFASNQNTCYEYAPEATNSVNSVPFGTTAKYSWTQMIYTPDKVGGTGTIRSISFLSADYSDLLDTSIVVYMGIFPNAATTTAAYWVPQDSLTEVFRSGSYQHIKTIGWETITLDTPFEYDGTQNLVICVSSEHSRRSDNTKYAVVSAPARTCMVRVGDLPEYATYPAQSASQGRSAVSQLPLATFCFTGGCSAPKTPVVSNVSTDSADITWASSGAAEYQYICLPDTAILDWANAQTTTSLSVKVTGLNANTLYRFYVRSVCGASVYSNEVMAAFRTECPATYSVPFVADFDNEITGGANITTYPNYVYCWDRVNDATQVANQGWPYINNTAGQMRSGAGKCLYFTQQVATSTMLGTNIAVLPLFSLPVDTLQLSFWAKKSTATAEGYMYVGVMSDPTDISTLVVTDTFFFERTNGDYTKITAFFNRYTGTGNYLAIGCGKSIAGITSPLNFYVDDVEVTLAPTCFTPKTPTLRRAENSSAVIEWVANGNETSWQAQYRNVDSLTWIDHPFIITNDSLVITGLSGNTKYEARVRAFCSPTDQSEWTNAVQFTTDCDEYISIPFVANFDNELTGGANGTNFPNFVHCWQRLTNSTTAGYTGYPYVNGTAAYQQSKTGKCIQFCQFPSAYAASYPQYQTAILPAVDPMMTPINTLQISFWAKKSAANMPLHIVVGVMTDPTQDSTFVAVQDIDLLTLTDISYHYYTADFHRYQGNGTYVAIKVPRNLAGVTTNSSTSNIYIDDIVLDYGSTCFTPEDITASGVTQTSASLSWTPGDTETEWNIQYKAAADTVWTMVPGTVTNPYTLTGLTPATSYEFKVRSYCSATDASEWSAPVSFLTRCATRTVAEFDTVGFENAEGFVTGSGNLANCWYTRTITAYSPVPFVDGTTAGAAYQGTNALSINAYANTTYTTNYDSSYVVLPEVAFDYPASAYNLDFYIKKYAATTAAQNYNDTLWVGVMSDIYDFSTFQRIGYVTSTSTTYAPVSINLSNFPATGGSIALLAAVNRNASATSYRRARFFVDNVTFSMHQYSVTANSNDTQMGTVNRAQTTKYYNESDTIIATPAANHHLVRWSNGCTNDTLIYNVTSDTTFTAYFAIDSFEVSTAVSGAQYGSVSNDAGVTSTPAAYPYGTVINFTATANAHADFVGWSNGSTATTTTYTVTRDTIIGATFVNHAYTLAAASADATKGTATVTPASAFYGDTVAFTATPAANYHFLRWSNGNTNATYLHRVEDDFSLTAYFAIDSFEVSVAVTGAEYGNVTNDRGVTVTPTYYPYGTIINFFATPNAHADFISWSNGSTVGITSYTVTADTVIGATFANHAYTIAAATSDAAMGSASVTPATAYVGESVTFTAVPAPFYHFVSWSNGATTATYNHVVDGDITLTAIFAPDTFAVSITVTGTQYGTVTNDGGVTATPKYYPYGTVINFAAIAAAHADFTGWSNGSTAITTSYTVAADTVITAGFANHLYNITALAADATMGSATVNPTTAYAGASVTFTATPAAHHHFVNWSNGATTATYSQTVDGDITLIANFAADTFPVSLTVNGSQYGSVTSDAGVTATPKYYAYGTIITVTAVPNAHADFVGWSNGSTATTTTYTVTASTTITATFANHAYTISAATSDAAMGSATVNPTSAYYGQSVTFTATPAAHHHFVSWSNGATTATYSQTVNGDIALTANFAADTFAVSLAVTGAEYGSVTNNADVTATPKYYPYGTVINFTAVPNAHADFIGWSNGATTLTTSYTVTGDVVVGATFANHVYNVTVSSSDDNMGSVAASAASGVYGDTVMIQATANTGYKFVNWSNGKTNDVIYMVITSDINLTANFDYIRYNVSATSADETMGVVVDVTELAEYHYGDVATFRAVANAGYEFVSWNTGETTDVINITVTSDITLVATFRAIGTGVENVNGVEYIVYADNMTIVLHGAENQAAACYDAAGRLVSMVASATEDQQFTVYTPGVYVIRVNDRAITVLVK